MPKLALTTGNEVLLREALAYLERRGLPPGDIRSVKIDGEVGQPLMLTVQLYVSEYIATPVPEETTSG